VERVLSGRSEVRASSPAGARLRVVLAPGSSAAVGGVLAPLGASLQQASPDFEDLFLARIGGEPS
jgi:ABC-2 type transport system ATP-binding protein